MRLGRGARVHTPDLTYAAVPIWTPDERGAALFHGLTNNIAGHLNSAVRIDARGSAWGGLTVSPQAVMAPGRLGGGRPAVDPSTTIDQTRGATTPVQAIFEQRMAARRLG